MPGGDGATEPLATVLPTGRTRDEEFTAFMTAAAPSLARTAWLLALTGQDGLGRAGEVLRYTDSQGAVTELVRDPATGLLLEEAYPQSGGWVRYLEQRPVDDVPVEPTLEIAGCATWATC